MLAKLYKIILEYLIILVSSPSTSKPVTATMKMQTNSSYFPLKDMAISVPNSEMLGPAAAYTHAHQ